MNNIAIRCEGLGKRYRIGERESYRALRDTITSAMSAPLRRIRSAFNNSVSEQQNGDKTFWALKDVSFEIKRGEVVGVMGRNGAGKSTLLKILSRITAPTAGEVEITGRVGSLLEVGTGFHPELTGRENIYLNGAILGMKKAEIERKFDEIVTFAEIEQFLDTPVKHYSSGMYVRLAFSVAAHLEPDILLVDEVLAVGDAEFQKKCIGKMGDSVQLGRTVVFVSHNMNAIEHLCSSAILLDRGEIKAISLDVHSIIWQYLYPTDEFAVCEWINKGDEYNNLWFKPLRFFISDGNGDLHSMPLSNDSEIWLNIEAHVAQIDPALTVGYAIYSENNQLLYWSYQTDETLNNWPKLSKGDYVLRSRIPGRLLNEGSYRIELIGGLHHRLWLFEPEVNAPSISFTIKGGLSDSPMWMTKRPGILAPVMKWHSNNEDYRKIN